MSDGPYRSLPMRRAWKKVAELAENENFAVHQVTDRVFQAVVKDFRKEVPRDAVTQVQLAFAEGEEYLFPDPRAHYLSNARGLVEGSPLGAIFLDCAAQELAEGRAGQQGLLNAVGTAIHERMQREARRIEEHYLRHPDSSRELTVNVCQRIQEAISHVSTDDIARQILGIDPIRRSGAVRYEGLDDGVPLS